MEEDFLSCAQCEKETLPNFYRMFLQLKAQALEVSDKSHYTSHQSIVSRVLTQSSSQGAAENSRGALQRVH
jgi:hypothetical protein